MIARPSWERPLRRRLRQKLENRGHAIGWVKENTALIAVWLVVQIVLMTEGEQQLGARGGATGIGIGAGLAGAFIALCLRSRWQHQAWLTEWTPASHAIVRRIQSRELLSQIAPIANTVLLTSVGIAALSPATGVVDALAAAWFALLAGFLLAGGRISTGILFASAIGVAGYSLLSPWLLDNSARWMTRLLHGAAAAWLPVLPWSNVVHGSPGGSLSWLAPGAALVISLREWRRSWTTALAHPARLDFAAKSDEDYEAEEILEDNPESESQEPAAEDQRKLIRQQVAFGWFGMAGYLPHRPMPPVDRWIWRWLTPRERLISTLGSHDAFGWFAQTRWAAISLVIMAGLGWLARWTRQQAVAGSWIDVPAYAWIAAFAAPVAVTLISGWPARRSRFQLWLDPMAAQGISRFPAFALLPISPGEWLCAAAKEWFARSCWISLLCSLAIMVGFPGLVSGDAAPWSIGLVALPWLLFTALFPISAMNRLLRAVAGPATRAYGLGFSLLASLSAFLGLFPMALAILALGTGRYSAGLMSAMSGVAIGAFSLWMTLLRCKSMRLDLQPKGID